MQPRQSLSEQLLSWQLPFLQDEFLPGQDEHERASRVVAIPDASTNANATNLIDIVSPYLLKYFFYRVLRKFFFNIMLRVSFASYEVNSAAFALNNKGRFLTVTKNVLFLV